MDLPEQPQRQRQPFFQPAQAVVEEVRRQLELQQGQTMDPVLNDGLAQDPVIWWSITAAFVFMVALVLAANLFADAVREAFDPRAAALPRRRRAPRESAA